MTASAPRVRRVLVWDSKHDSVFWDASTPEKEAEAYLAMFIALDKFQAYDGIKDGGETDAEQELREVRELKARPRDALSPDELERLVRALRNEKQMERDAAISVRQRDLYRRAAAGDADAARDLLELRGSYEYESWRLEEVGDPAEDLKRSGLRVTGPLAERRRRTR